MYNTHELARKKVECYGKRKPGKYWNKTISVLDFVLIPNNESLSMQTLFFFCAPYMRKRGAMAR